MLAKKYMHDFSLGAFDPIFLSDLTDQFLMNRKEVKYFFHQRYLYPILEFLQEEFLILEINGDRKQSYQSHYLDTEDRRLYINHHNGHDNRFKFRFRHYLSSDMTFFEIKHRKNTGNTEKFRIPLNGLSKLERTEAIDQFIQQNSAYKMSDFSKNLDIDYERIALVQKEKNARITIDQNIRCNKGMDEHAFDNLVILELKFNRHFNKYDFLKRMRTMKLYPRRISKYCLSTCTLVPCIKRNAFKQKLMKIKRIEKMTV